MWNIAFQEDHPARAAALEPISRISRRRFHMRRLLGIAALTLYSTEISAGDSGVFDFNGFGTLGVVHSDEDQADYVSNGRQSKGAGFTNSWSATPDSKFGAQLTGVFGERVSAAAQLVSQYQYDGTFTPYLEWANVKFQMTPDLDIRVGRIAIPTFMFSDSLNVGYALPYVRIPLEIYGQLPNSNSDGIDGSYRLHIGAATNTLHVYAGGFHSKTPGDGIYDVNELRGIADTVEFGATTLHLSYQTMNFDLRTPKEYVSNNPQTIVTLGATYDRSKWYVSGEVIRSADDAAGIYYAGYAIGGYRVDAFTPYIGHARTSMVKAGPLSLPSFIEQHTTTFGVRWDFRTQLDLKLQLDHTKRQGGTNIYFLNQQPGFGAIGALNVLTLTLDFVF